MKNLLRILVALVLAIGLTAAAHSQTQPSDTVQLSSLDLSAFRQGWGTAQADRTLDQHPITIAGKVYPRGVGTHSVGKVRIALNKGSKKFLAAVGVDDEINGHAGGTVDFTVIGDGTVLWKSPIMHFHQPASIVDVDVSSIDTLELRVGDGGDGNGWDHADWADARFVTTGFHPRTVVRPKSPPYVLTPLARPTPRITGPKIYGARPGNPFLFTLTATGTKPISFAAEGLPEGLSLEAATGIITGRVPETGTYSVHVQARNAIGSAERDLKIVIGPTIALTPPLGWNSWNCFAEAVDAKRVHDAADALIASGLADHGWSYINIDDCWMIKPGATDSMISGGQRNPDGTIRSNRKFPDMKALADYVHSRGLKIGLYSSPGKLTCAEYTACYEHEMQDAATFGSWGFDYLKYDWCSYDEIAKDHSLAELKKPYTLMRKALDAVSRDIVYSLCQYGMGDAWKWGTEVGGNCWRTTGDISDTWESMDGIGFGQAGHEEFAGPGHWNDPDMLVVGKVGWGPSLHPTALSPDEQYTHISLWALLASPLLIGCDLTQLDPFTFNLLANDEVLDINQDPLGRQAHRVVQRGETEVWAKPLEDGSQAVGLFNRSEAVSSVTVSWQELGLSGAQNVRDVWRETDLGSQPTEYRATVPSHGVVLIRLMSH